MAIDKTIPNRLQADADQRLVRPEVGEMLDAQNVTMAESGSSSSGVIKNVRGTIAGTPLYRFDDRIADSNAVTVIGSVSDPQRGYIYWFVADVNGSDQDAIYQYNTSDDTYRIVLKGSFLSFDPNGFVKADVLNAAFQQDGVIQTALYFTDNVNPPRKINVDRAISGDYAVLGQVSGDVDFSIPVIRACLTTPPTFFFETDENFSINNFREDSFQFAIQYIYKDGEESAISTYSKIAVSNSIKESGVVDVLSSANQENVCVIDTKWVSENERTYKTDVKKIRVLGRIRNGSTFYIIDEFDPNLSISREFDGVDINVYDSALGYYRFYNEGLYSVVSSDTVNKIYDNVPLLASGQSIAGNRLMYSNYTEGRENNPVSANLSVNYSPDSPSGSSSYHDQSNAGSAITIGLNSSDVADGKVVVDLTSIAFTWPSPNDQTSVVPDNTTTRISFDYNLFSDVYKTGAEVHTVSCVGDNGTFDLDFGTDTSNKFPIRLADSSSSDPNPLSVSAIYTTSGSQDVENISDGLKDLLIDTQNESSYIYTATNVSAVVSNSTDPGVPDGGSVLGTVKFKLVMGFDEISDTADDGQFIISPYIKEIEVLTHDFSVVNSITSQSTNSLLLSTQATYDADPTQTGGTYILNPTVYSQSPSLVSSFKMGSSHEFGVVYYDKWGRSGYVNKAGSVYVDHTAERTSNYGPASITMSFSAGEEPPSWADSWQPVYRGMSSFDDFTTYTTGGGYPVRVNGGTTLVESDHRIYVSLNTLDIYNEEQGGFRDYSFTEGDILRVISRTEGVTGTVFYPSANDGSPIEFEVLGVEILEQDAENPILGNESQGTHHTGKFIVLQAPAVDGGRQVDDNGNGTADADLKYNGFDWFSITGSNYPNDGNSTVANYWGNETVVEILSPRKTTTNNVFYEIGERQKANSWITSIKIPTQHGPALRIREGDVHFRVISCQSPVYSSSWNVNSNDQGEEWDYVNKVIETRTLSDKQSEVCWSKGRPHVPFENAAEVNRYNGITYSDAYAEDVANLSLSSFNPSLANFFSLDSANGACNYIGTFRDDYLLAFQENRVARVPVNKDIITSPTTDGIVSISTNVLNAPAYYAGDFGCGSNPESVLIRDGNGFFVDTSRKKLVRLTTEGLSPISENGVDNMFKSNLDSFLAQGGSRIVSGYDPEDDQYYVTLRQIDNPSYDPEVEGSEEFLYGGLTLGYNVSAGVWQSRYTFYPDMYADQNSTMYSSFYVEGSSNDSEIFHSHTNETDYNTFYGTFGESLIKVVSNYNPSMVKVFNALSLEGGPGDTSWTATSILTDTEALGSIDQGDFVTKEGSRYAPIRRDSSSNSTKHIIPIGEVVSVNIGSGLISFVNRVNTLPLMAGSAVMEVDGSGNLTDIGTPIGGNNTPRTLASVAGTREIQLNAGTSVSLTGSNLVLVTDQDQNGDPIRGHWAEITLTNNQATPIELYCVNTHFVQSNQDHSLGQQ